MIAPVSLRAGVQLRATLYVYVGISDLSILKTSLSQYHKHFCFGLILQLFFCVCQLTTYFAPCTKSLPGFLLVVPPPPTSPMIAPVSLPAGVQLRANLYDPSILKTWLAHYNIHSLFWSHIDDDVFCGKKCVWVTNSFVWSFLTPSKFGNHRIKKTYTRNGSFEKTMHHLILVLKLSLIFGRCCL